MTTVKIIAGLCCIITGLVLPAGLALGQLTHFGFSQGLGDLNGKDILLGSAFAVCAIALAAAGIFLIIRCRESLSKQATILIPSILAISIFAPLSRVYYLRAHSVSDAEDRRRWLREFDRENEKNGLVKLNDGTWSFSSPTNPVASASATQ
jgi:hypothetical protein